MTHAVQDAGSSLKLAAKLAALQDFRRRFPEKVVRVGGTEWRYRAVGSAARALLALPGGELVNDLGFEFALAISSGCRVIYPAYPRVSSLQELSDGLHAVLNAENIERCAILGASFGGAVAQVFVRRHPERIDALILSNTGVPLRYLAPSVRIFEWIAQALPWPVTTSLLRKPMLKTLDPSGIDEKFWSWYLDELFSIRLTKADVLSNFRNQYEYHRRFHFLPADLKTWSGRILIAESDTDIIGPRRRKALRETYPQAEIYTYHDAGHAPMFSRFSEYLTMVTKFLDLNPAPLS